MNYVFCNAIWEQVNGTSFYDNQLNHGKSAQVINKIIPIVHVFKQNVLFSDLDHFLDLNLWPHKREEGTLSSYFLAVIYFCETLTVKSKPSKGKL